MTLDKPGVPSSDREQKSLLAVRSLDRKSRRTWSLLVYVAIITNVGLAAAILAIRSGAMRSPWPWADTELLLLGVLTFMVLLFVGYLTLQERHLSRLREELLRANEQASLRMRAYYDRLVALLNVSRVFASETNPQTVFDAITATCLETFECQQASLMLFNLKTEELEVRSVAGGEEDARELATAQKLGQGIAGWVAKERKPIVLGAAAPEGACNPFPEGTPLPAAAIVVPILLRGDLIGVLAVSSSSPDIFHVEEDLQALQVFAETAGICCRHAEQTDWMRQTIQRLDATLQKMGIDETHWAA
jgi:transcriptional regulator with GAF, ATPase, and Fis domain